MKTAKIRWLGFLLLIGGGIIMFLAANEIIDEESDMSPQFGLTLIIWFGLVLVFFGIHLAQRNACPACQREKALVKTGNTKREGGWLFGSNYEEWRCKHCEYEEWKKKPTYGGQ